jgi:hypothetical protein
MAVLYSTAVFSNGCHGQEHSAASVRLSGTVSYTLNAPGWCPHVLSGLVMTWGSSGLQCRACWHSIAKLCCADRRMEGLQCRG